MRTDDELLVAHGRGETGAFDELVRRHQGPLTGFLRRLLRDEALAEDGVVETLFKIHRAAATYEPSLRFKTYLYTVAYREGISLLRKRNKGVNRHSQGIEVGAELVCSSPSPADSLEQQQSLRAVEAVLLGLPEVQRAAFTLYYREGLATAEIAEALDIPGGSVRAYLTMARKAIRLALPNEYAVSA